MKHLIWLISVFLLAACSSGGSDDEPSGGNGNGEQTAEVERISLTGLAVKGLARYAKVEAFTLSGNDFKNEADVVTATDAEGRYNILLPESLKGYEGPLKIKLSHQAGAELQCDISPSCRDDDGSSINFEAFYAMPTDFELYSVVDVGSGLTNVQGDTIANISALTTLATEFLERDGNTISSTTLKQSNNQIRAVFSLPKSVDLSSTEPQIVTSDETNGDDVYGAINAAFLTLAKNNSTTLNSIIENFAEQLTTPLDISKPDQVGQVYLKASDGDVNAPSILALASAADAILGDDTLDALVNTATAAGNGAVTDINPPSISAGDDQTVAAGANVVLPLEFLLPDGGEAGLTSPKYLWQVISGPLNLVGNATATTKQLTFTAPEEGGDIKLRAIIEAVEGSDNDIVIISVNPSLSGNTAASGQYQISGMHPAFYGGGAGLTYEHEVFIDELDLTFNADGSGVAVADAANTSEFYEGRLTLGVPDAMTFQDREASIGTIGAEDAFTINFKQLTSGGLLLTTLSGVEDKVTDFDPNITERIIVPARDIRFYEIGTGLYAASTYFNETAYFVENGIQPAEPNERRVGFEQLAFHKANNLTRADINGKAYTGIEWWMDITDGATPSFDVQVAKILVDFSNNGNQLNVSESVQKLSGLPNADHTGADSTFTLTAPPTAPSSDDISGLDFTNGRLSNGLGGSPMGDIFYLAFSSDLKAASITGFEYSNDSGSDFVVTDSAYEGTSSGVFIEKPATPANLNNKMMDVSFQNYLVENSNTAGNPVAPEIILESYQGQMVITDGELKMQLEYRQGRVSYPDGQVDAQPNTINTKVTYDSNTTYMNSAIPLASTTQDANGCVQESGGNFELCVGENGTVIGWSYNNELEGTFQTLSLGRLLGKVTGDYTPAGFTNADLEAFTFEINYPEGVAPYTFNADKTGTVTFPGETQEPLEWFIDGEGRLIVELTSNETDRYTLTSGTPTTGTITLEIDSGNGYVVIEEGINRAWAKQP